ncbi:ISAzo13-like element transposase-related protein [Singulisphaera acidiphila]|uniref:ISAzo13-like element transposase-related protein n=1 Tax=Singulisphaera acidiphila TaxID=466153 RepID=UPI0012F9B872
MRWPWSATGFHCRACLDRTAYKKGVKVTREERAAIRLKPRSVLPQWNYTIWPHRADRK